MTEEIGSSDHKIVHKSVPTFYFIGVTTSQSSINEVFPLWMKALGRPDIVIEGVDHTLHDARQAYRQTVAQIKYDPLSLGALITSHKIDILEAAGDMFDVLHSSAEITGEVSCVSKQDGLLVGHAKDLLGQLVQPPVGVFELGRVAPFEDSTKRSRGWRRFRPGWRKSDLLGHSSVLSTASISGPCASFLGDGAMPQ